MTNNLRPQLGLVLTGVDAASRTGREQLEDSIALTRAARDNGFQLIAVGQHFLGHPYQYLQPIPLLARLSVESGSMRLATGVLLLSLLHPVDVAEQLATLDTICGGRLVMAVGIGYRNEEFDAFGIAARSRMDRMLESLSVVQRLWTTEPVSHEGRFFQLRASRIGIAPTSAKGPEVWIAGMGRNSVTRTISMGLKPFLGPRAKLQQVAEWVSHYRAASGDPDATLPLRRDVFVSASSSIAHALAGDYVGPRLATYRAWGMLNGLRDQQGRNGMGDDEVIVGDARDCMEALWRYAAVGADPIVLRVQWPKLPVAESLRMIERISLSV